MAYDYRKLRGKIVEKYGTQTKFAEAMGWSIRTASLKMTGKRFWNQTEITRASELLGIQNNEVADYFFCEKSSI